MSGRIVMVEFEKKRFDANYKNKNRKKRNIILEDITELI
jgi:hypothetical protein